MNFTDNLLHNQNFLKDKKTELKISQFIIYYCNYKMEGHGEAIFGIIIMNVFLLAFLLFGTLLFLFLCGVLFSIITMFIPGDSGFSLMNYDINHTLQFVLSFLIYFYIIWRSIYSYNDFWNQSGLILFDAPLKSSGDIVFHYDIKKYHHRAFVQLSLKKKFEHRNKYLLIPRSKLHMLSNLTAYYKKF